MKEFEKQLSRMRRWCALRERCEVETRIHANNLGFPQENIEKILRHLKSEQFLNEERFAKLYAGSKFRYKHWGRQRIIGELRARQIPEKIIQIGLSEIDEKEYRESVKNLVKHKIEITDPSNELLFKHRLAKSAIGKGYEADLVHEVIDELIKNKKAGQ
ncbi:Regulatory protein RecX [anaerobic digester metagenome]|nr:regulatory protein RecX [Lentimicrobiaceae bacterium]